MIDGPGFFIVSASPLANPIPNGTPLTSNDGIMLSRVGILAFDSEGNLVDDQGSFVLGYGLDGNGAVNTGLDMIKAKNGQTYTSISVQTDGTITAVVEKDTTGTNNPGDVEMCIRDRADNEFRNSQPYRKNRKYSGYGNGSLRGCGEYRRYRYDL